MTGGFWGLLLSGSADKGQNRLEGGKKHRRFLAVGTSVAVCKEGKVHSRIHSLSSQGRWPKKFTDVKRCACHQPVSAWSSSSQAPNKREINSYIGSMHCSSGKQFGSRKSKWLCAVDASYRVIIQKTNSVWAGTDGVEQKDSPLT